MLRFAIDGLKKTRQERQPNTRPNSSYAQTQMKITGARKQKNQRKEDLTTANEQKGDGLK